MAGHLEQLVVVTTLALAVNLETKQTKKENVIHKLYVTSWLAQVGSSQLPNFKRIQQKNGERCDVF